MAETNPSHQVDGEVSSFELISDTAHVQRGQRNEIIQEGQTNNDFPSIFGSVSRVVSQTTTGPTFQPPPRIITQTTNGATFQPSSGVAQQTPPPVQTPSNGAGPSAPSEQAQLNFSALLGLPEGKALASWYAEQMASINLVYTQLSAQQALLQAQANQSAFVTPPQRSLSTHTTQQTNAWNLRPEKGPVPNIRKPSAHDTRDTYGETESNYVQHSHLQRRPIQSRLGAPNMNAEWDDEEDDPTYKGESTVFSRLHPEHEAYKPPKRAGYNPKAEHDYTLSYRPNDMAENSKFIKAIATAAIDKTKLPHNVGKYNGLTDPDDHLQVFNGAGATGGWNLPTWCHLFAQTFIGAARVWFDSLPAGRIKSWIDFRDKFLAHFSQQRRHTRDPVDCLNIWRKDHGSVEDFITRYNKECLEIGDVGEKMMRAHFMRGWKTQRLGNLH
ncbi:putative retrotransposon gag domain-containing protein [Helianthus annuus]|nr:putative retrotransposon gag domain-containing protein [Helianthus annuus]KAJ0898434.1 putative retrotransposon gag domain-containing protein [Helianthus annuus]